MKIRPRVGFLICGIVGMLSAFELAIYQFHGFAVAIVFISALLIIAGIMWFVEESDSGR